MSRGQRKAEDVFEPDQGIPTPVSSGATAASASVDNSTRTGAARASKSRSMVESTASSTDSAKPSPTTLLNG